MLQAQIEIAIPPTASEEEPGQLKIKANLLRREDATPLEFANVVQRLVLSYLELLAEENGLEKTDNRIINHPEPTEEADENVSESN